VGLVQDRRDGWNIFYHVVKTEIYEIIDLALRMNDGSKATVRYAVEAKISNPDCPCPKCQPALEHTPV
jgi:hypothetical protein